MSMLYARIVPLVSNVNIKKADRRIEGRGLRPRDNIRLRRTAPLRLRLGFSGCGSDSAVAARIQSLSRQRAEHRSTQSDCSFNISVLYLYLPL
jgi:hypothetical protein